MRYNVVSLTFRDGTLTSIFAIDIVIWGSNVH